MILLVLAFLIVTGPYGIRWIVLSSFVSYIEQADVGWDEADLKNGNLLQMHKAIKKLAYKSC